MTARAMNPARILSVYRMIFCALIAVASAQTLVGAPTRHVIMLATLEIAGAALLLWRRSQYVGAPVLVLVFATAQLMAASEGEYPTRFLQYSASTMLIVILDRVLSRNPPARLRS